ncbi:MAG: CBS domain-containing protein [Gammaproteobacteria bacterium]|jgi:acetoin utilization protein AcuB
MHRLPHLATAMTPFPYSIDKNAPLKEAIALMEEHDVRHLPVTEDATLVGLIAERDIAPPNKDRSKEIDELKVSDIYVDNPYVVSLDEPLDQVLLTMADRHIGSAIVTRGGKLAGMFTCVDACRSFGKFLQNYFPHPPGDQAA